MVDNVTGASYDQAGLEIWTETIGISVEEFWRQNIIILGTLEELVKKREATTLDSKTLIKLFLDSDACRFKGIELIIYIICTG